MTMAGTGCSMLVVMRLSFMTPSWIPIGPAVFIRFVAMGMFMLMPVDQIPVPVFVTVFVLFVPVIMKFLKRPGGFPHMRPPFRVVDPPWKASRPRR